MKEVVSAFGSDVLRPLISLVLPGSLATAPGLIAAIWAVPPLRTIVMQNQRYALLVLVLLVLFFGLLCEDLGSHLEYWFDCRHNKPSPKRTAERKKTDDTDNWYSYLRIAYRIEPVGHHYLRTLVLRLKFELGSFAALAIALIGIWWFPDSHYERLMISMVPAALMIIFYFEARWTHDLLSDLRAELLKGISEWPPVEPKTLDATAGR